MSDTQTEVIHANALGNFLTDLLESHRDEVNQYVYDHPDAFGIAVTTTGLTAIDVTEKFVLDPLQLGSGLGQASVDGSWLRGSLQDGSRFLAVLPAAGSIARAAVLPAAAEATGVVVPALESTQEAGQLASAAPVLSVANMQLYVREIAEDLQNTTITRTFADGTSQTISLQGYCVPFAAALAARATGTTVYASASEFLGGLSTESLIGLSEKGILAADFPVVLNRLEEIGANLEIPQVLPQSFADLERLVANSDPNSVVVFSLKGITPPFSKVLDFLEEAERQLPKEDFASPEGLAHATTAFGELKDFLVANQSRNITEWWPEFIATGEQWAGPEGKAVFDGATEWLKSNVGGHVMTAFRDESSAFQMIDPGGIFRTVEELESARGPDLIQAAFGTEIAIVKNAMILGEEALSSVPEVVETLAAQGLPDPVLASLERVAPLLAAIGIAVEPFLHNDIDQTLSDLQELATPDASSANDRIGWPDERDSKVDPGAEGGSNDSSSGSSAGVPSESDQISSETTDSAPSRLLTASAVYVEQPETEPGGELSPETGNSTDPSAVTEDAAAAQADVADAQPEDSLAGTETAAGAIDSAPIEDQPVADAAALESEGPADLSSAAAAPESVTSEPQPSGQADEPGSQSFLTGSIAYEEVAPVESPATAEDAAATQADAADAQPEDSQAGPTTAAGVEDSAPVEGQPVADNAPSESDRPADPLSAADPTSPADAPTSDASAPSASIETEVAGQILTPTETANRKDSTPTAVTDPAPATDLSSAVAAPQSLTSEAPPSGQMDVSPTGSDPVPAPAGPTSSADAATSGASAPSASIETDVAGQILTPAPSQTANGADPAPATATGTDPVPATGTTTDMPDASVVDVPAAPGSVETQVSGRIVDAAPTATSDVTDQAHAPPAVVAPAAGTDAVSAATTTGSADTSVADAPVASASVETQVSGQLDTAPATTTDVTDRAAAAPAVVAPTAGGNDNPTSLVTDTSVGDVPMASASVETQVAGQVLDTAPVATPDVADETAAAPAVDPSTAGSDTNPTTDVTDTSVVDVVAAQQSVETEVTGRLLAAAPTSTPDVTDQTADDTNSTAATEPVTSTPDATFNSDSSPALADNPAAGQDLPATPGLTDYLVPSAEHSALFADDSPTDVLAVEGPSGTGFDAWTSGLSIDPEGLGSVPVGLVSVAENLGTDPENLGNSDGPSASPDTAAQDVELVTSAQILNGSSSPSGAEPAAETINVDPVTGRPYAQDAVTGQTSDIAQTGVDSGGNPVYQAPEVAGGGEFIVGTDASVLSATASGPIDTSVWGTPPSEDTGSLYDSVSYDNPAGSADAGTGGSDSGGSGTGSESGSTDSGGADSGTSDSGGYNSGASDSGSYDSSTSDSGSYDSSTSDSGGYDSGTSGGYDSGTSGGYDSGASEGAPPEPAPDPPPPAEAES